MHTGPSPRGLTPSGVAFSTSLFRTYPLVSQRSGETLVRLCLSDDSLLDVRFGGDWG